jgi:Ala-tRNA(Pro) deacylase
LINNNDKDVNFYLDKDILDFDLCNFHPLINTKTIQMKTDDCINLLKSLAKVNIINFKTKEVTSL